MNMQALALAFLSAVTVGGVAWVFIYPLLSGEKQTEKRVQSFARTEPALRIDDRSRTRRVQVEDTLKELEQKLAEQKAGRAGADDRYLGAHVVVSEKFREA